MHLELTDIEDDEHEDTDSDSSSAEERASDDRQNECHNGDVTMKSEKVSLLFNCAKFINLKHSEHGWITQYIKTVLFLIYMNYINY